MQIKRIIAILLSACAATVSYNSMAMNEGDAEALLINEQQNDNDTNELCIICLGSITQDQVVKTNSCGHKYHYLCLDTWLKQKENNDRRCPMCRAWICPRCDNAIRYDNVTTCIFCHNNTHEACLVRGHCPNCWRKISDNLSLGDRCCECFIQSVGVLALVSLVAGVFAITYDVVNSAV